MQLAIVRLVPGGLLDNLQGLDAPDLQSKLLTNALEAGVKDSGKSRRWLESFII